MKKLINWILNVFANFNSVYNKYRTKAEAVVKFINQIKQGIESGTLDALGALTPTDKDDKILTKIRKAMASVAQDVAHAEGIIVSGSDGVTSLTALGTYLAGKSKSARLKFWVEFAGKLIEAVADGELTIAEGIALTQLVYSELKK